MILSKIVTYNVAFMNATVTALVSPEYDSELERCQQEITEKMTDFHDTTSDFRLDGDMKHRIKAQVYLYSLRTDFRPKPVQLR